MTKQIKYHKVTFLPENRSVMVENLKSVFETIIDNNPEGIPLHFSCGAEGICRKCKIRSFQAMGPLTPTERGCLSEAELKRGIRLACQARVTQNTEAEILYKEPFTVFRINRQIKGIADMKPGILKKIRVAEVDEKENADRSGAGERCFTEVYFEHDLVVVEPGDTTGKLFAALVDIGINTLTVSLVDISAATEMVRIVDTNPTLSMGRGIEQRTEQVAEDRLFLELLCEELVLRIDVLIDALCSAGGVLPENIYEIMVCGATAMVHLFFERAGHGRQSRAVVRPVMQAGDFHIYSAKHAVVSAVSSGSNQLGSDFLCAIAGSGVLHSEGQMLIHVGTETKAALNVSEKCFVAGVGDCEVYEGVGVAFGMRTETGAIESVRIEDDVRVSVIGESLPRGVCGSGLMELAWQLKQHGLVDPEGRFIDRAPFFTRHPAVRHRLVTLNGSRAFVLFSRQGEFESHVSVTEEEMVLFFSMLKKTAAMIETLLKAAQADWEGVSQVIIGGPFARSVDRAVFAGLWILPEHVEKKLSFMENPVMKGLQKLLLCGGMTAAAAQMQDNIVYVPSEEACILQNI